MKLLRALMSIVILVIAGLLGGSTSSAETTYYQDWAEKANVDPHHNWTIKLNQKLDESTVNGNNVYIFQDNSSNVEGVEVILNEDETSITVKAPEEGYKAGEEYLLCIEKEVLSLNGKGLKQPIMMKFTIAVEESDLEQIVISDLELESLIKETLYWTIGSSEITKESMLKIKGLNVAGSGIIGIKDLTGLEYASNLEGAYLSGNQISDISPLINLENLQYIDLSGNQVSDISPLTNLKNLQYIDLSRNQVSDINPLIKLPNLKEVVLNDIPLNEDAMEVISRLEERGVSIDY